MKILVAKIVEIFRYLIVSNAGLSEDEIAFIKIWELEKVWLLARHTTKVMAIVLTISIIPISILSPAPQRYAQIPTHTLMSLISLIWAFKHKELKAYTMWLAFALAGVAAAGYAIAIALAFLNGADINSLVFLIAIHSAITIVSVTQYPFSNGTILIWTCGVYAATTAAISADKSIDLMRVYQVYAFVLIIATWFRYALVQNIRSEALTEFAYRQLIIAEHREQSIEVERQLHEARELQSSFTPSFEKPQIPGLKIDIYHKRVERLATAWCGVRHLTQGESVVFLADATTLGVSAALIIHSLQALWVLSLNASNFSPESWLTTAQRALGAVSQEVEGAINLSLAVFAKDYVALYSTNQSNFWLTVESGEKNDGRSRGIRLISNSNHTPSFGQTAIRKIIFQVPTKKNQAIILATKNETLEHIDGEAKDLFEAKSSVAEQQADRLMVWVSYAEAS